MRSSSAACVSRNDLHPIARSPGAQGAVWGLKCSQWIPCSALSGTVPTSVSVSWGPSPPPLSGKGPFGARSRVRPREFDHPLREEGLRVAKQGYLAPQDHSGAGS